MITRLPLQGPLALLLLGSLSLPAQLPEGMFQEQAGLLSNSGIPDSPFRTTTPIGVVDLDGDRRDDIVRVHFREYPSLEFQTSPGAAFGHLVPAPDIFDQPGPDLDWKWVASICVADADRNGINDILIGAYKFPDGGGLELYLGNDFGTAWSTGRDEVPKRPYVRDADLLVQGTIFADLNNDGHIDIFSCDDEDDPEKFINDGTGGYSPAAAGVFDTFIAGGNPGNPPVPPNEGNYAIIGTDYDNDGDIDYYLSKCRLGDTEPIASLARINRFFVNDGSENYTDLSGAAGLADPDQTWCADFADVDNDGDLDCFILNHQSGNSGGSSFFLNDGAGNFSDSTAAAGFAGNVDFIGNQALFRDFNSDGFIDLLVADMEDTETDPNFAGYGYYQNDGDGTFTAYDASDGIFKTAIGGGNLNRVHSFAVGDLNHDGHLDLYVGRGRGINRESSQEDVLCFNQDTSNGYLAITLVGGPSCNPNGIGARLEAHGPWGVGGGQGIQVREVRGGEGYGIMNSLNTHFGLGAATQVDQLVVRWPTGTVDTINNVAGNRYVTVFEGTGTVAIGYIDYILGYYPGGGANTVPTADPDEDGIENAVEQLLGGVPNVFGPASGVQESVVNDGGQDYFLIEVDRVPTVDVFPGMEFSTDGENWAPDPAMEVLENTPLRYVVRLAVDLSTNPVYLARLTAQFVPS